MYAHAALLLLLPGAGPPADFALKDGDTVAFLGDSITAAGQYGKYIEQYTLLRFPGRKVRFFNAGQGGDTAAGGLKRLHKDVLDRGATVVIVACGTNDIGWGVYADDKHKRAYLDGIGGIVEACVKRKVRVYVCSAAVTGADPFKSEDSFLQTMCDEGMALARRKGGQAIDVQRGMREVQKRVWRYNEAFAKGEKGKESLHVADGVHLNDLGQLAMAYAILRGLGAPREVSSVRIDARGPRVVSAAGCEVSGLASAYGKIKFTRLDRGLPFNYGIFFALHYRFVPLHEEMNRYGLRVEGLAPGRYTVRADERIVGTFTAGQLAAGVNVASTTASAWEPGGPWNAQADALRSLTEARHQLGLAGVQARAYLPGAEATAGLEKGAAKVNADLEAVQRRLARPRAYRFVIERAAGKKDKGDRE